MTSRDTATGAVMTRAVIVGQTRRSLPVHSSQPGQITIYHPGFAATFAIVGHPRRISPFLTHDRSDAGDPAARCPIYPVWQAVPVWLRAADPRSSVSGAGQAGGAEPRRFNPCKCLQDDRPHPAREPDKTLGLPQRAVRARLGQHHRIGDRSAPGRASLSSPLHETESSSGPVGCSSTAPTLCLAWPSRHLHRAAPLVPAVPRRARCQLPWCCQPR